MLKMKRPDNCCGVGTFEHEVCMPISGRLQGVDFCISDIVAALNAGNVITVGSCCGHGKRKGIVNLIDGRIITVEGYDRG